MMSSRKINIIGGNSKVLRNANRAMILNVIRIKQPISRVQIAKMSGLNKSTVSSIVTDLLEEELIIEKNSEDQNVGRNPIHLSIKLGRHMVGAINIDSLLTRFAIADIDGSIIGTSEITTEAGKKDEFVKDCIDELKNLCKSLSIDELDGIGVTVTGIVDPKRLIVDYAPNLGWEDFKIGDVIREYWPELKILTIGNDAKSSALAESWFGHHEFNLSNFVFLSIGSGIGSGIVVDNNILNGEFNASGEVGHITIYEGGELCSCGNHGCLEAYASDKATVKRYIDKKHSNPQEPVDIEIQDIINMAKSNDKIAIDVLKSTGYYLGLGISTIIKSIDPHAIIIGGRIVQVWDIIFPEITYVIEKKAFFGNKKKIQILPTSLKIKPRLLGAAALTIKEIFNDFKIMA
ncbi:MAG: ROK family transcriptional regulator [Ignavibacteria bacterium]|jgi:predicted NBD/HSP70 family sugar kinase